MMFLDRADGYFLRRNERLERKSCTKSQKAHVAAQIKLLTLNCYCHDFHTFCVANVHLLLLSSKVFFTRLSLRSFCDSLILNTYGRQ